MALAGILLIPGLATLWTAWDKFTVPVPPDPVPLTLAGAGALAVNLACAFMLAATGRTAEVVGLGIAAMNAYAARQVWEAAREEHKIAKA